MGILCPSEQKYYEQENVMTKQPQNEGIYLASLKKENALSE